MARHYFNDMKENKRNHPHGFAVNMRLCMRVFILGLVMVCGFSVMTSGAVATKGTFSAEFEKAVAVIKKYEGLHRNKGELVGYGHKILKGEPYKRNQNLSEAEADKLLRSDLQKLCAKYREFGKDSLLLSALAYNTGIGTVAKSSILKNIKAGNRSEEVLRATYESYCRYRGKVMSQIKRRRIEEFETLYFP